LIEEGAQIIDELTYGKRVDYDGGLYEYIGEARWENVNLSLEDYSDASLWRKLTDTLGEFLGTSTVTSGGAVTVSSTDSSGIDANSRVLSTAATENNLKGIVDLLDGFLMDDYKYTTESGERTVFNLNPLGSLFADHVVASLVPGQLVETLDGMVYEFAKTLAEETVDLALENFEDPTRWTRMVEDLAGEVFTGSELMLQTRVRIGSDYDEARGDRGAVYKYAGILPRLVDLSTEDYKDESSWEKVVGGLDDLDDLYPDIGNLTESDAKATGILVVLNEVRSDVSAYLENSQCFGRQRVRYGRCCGHQRSACDEPC